MFPEIRLTSNSITESIDIEKIVTRISVEDIERYVLRKYHGYLYTYETQQRIASDAKLLENYFRNQGYEIYRVHRIENEPKELINLRKENKKLRHEVSVLSKKLNKMEGN